MPQEFSRRSFLAAASTLGALGAAGTQPARAGAQESAAKLAPPPKPIAVSSRNGLRAVARAVELMISGEDTLEAVIAGVNIVEADPSENTVGYGGLPNEEGVVELDSCVMHGPSGRGGGVAALRDIKLPSRVAELVMKRTDHVLLVGEGARRFAIAHGFRPEDLLTDEARKEWLRWKEGLSDRDDWLTPEEAKAGDGAQRAERPSGTITCLGLNTAGDLSGVTTTSGLAFKIPGRVGDSPIIGAGLYVDNAVGAAGATGRGEAVILAGGSRIAVENLRRGMDPKAALLDVLERIVRQTVDPRLRDDKGRPRFDVVLYALRRDGAHAAAAMYRGATYSVDEGAGGRLEECAFLFEK
jgi:N4-(beta-N-acetylglucosaminyl)-L-asparaginase